MKSIFAVAALLGVATSTRVINELAFPFARRLDTNTNAFVEEDSFIQTEAQRRPHGREFVGVRFITQDDAKVNDELYKLNKITELGNHGFLITSKAQDYSGYQRKIEGEEDVKALIKQISAEGEEAEKAKENEESPGKAGDDE